MLTDIRALIKDLREICGCIKCDLVTRDYAFRSLVDRNRLEFNGRIWKLRRNSAGNLAPCLFTIFTAQISVIQIFQIQFSHSPYFTKAHNVTLSQMKWKNFVEFSAKANSLSAPKTFHNRINWAIV